MGEQCLDGFFRHGDKLGMHLVAGDGLRLHGPEGARTHVQCHLGGADPSLPETLHYRGREVEPRRGSCHGAFNTGVYRLVGLIVLRLGGAVEVGRDGQLSRYLQQLGEGVSLIIP